MTWRGWYQRDPAEPATLTELAEDNLADRPVRIAVARSAVNYKDALALTASAPIARRTPLVLGIDLAGEVLTSDDARFAPGDRVLATGCGLGERHHGGLATRTACDGDWLHPLPDGTDADWAMGLGTAGLTAWLAVERLRGVGLVPDRGPVAVTGASGGVGGYAVALLATLGYEVHAVTGSAGAGEELRRLGAAEILGREILAAGKPLRSARFAAAVDTVGGEPLAALLAQIEHLGAVAACGNVAGMALPTSVAPFILRGVALLGIDSTRVPREERSAAWAGLGDHLPVDLVASRSHLVDLAESSTAAGDLLAGRHRGRCVVRCD